MKKGVLQLLVVLGLTVLTFNSVYASHVRGADITYTHVSGNTFLFKLVVYRDCAGINVGSSQTVNFQSTNCGQLFSQTFTQDSVVDVSQVCAGYSTTCNGGTLPGTQAFYYSATVTMPAQCNDWQIYWSTCCRNSAITNLQNPGGAGIFVMITMDNLNAPTNSSPQFSAIPTPYICVGQNFSYNHGAYDPDSDSLVYTLAQPLEGTFPPGTPIAYNAGYSVNNPVIASVFNFNNATGEMCFTPTQADYDVIAIQIDEYRNGLLIGTYRREMQVVIQSSCSNSPPTAGSASGLCSGGAFTVVSGGPSVQILDSNSIAMCPNDSVFIQIAISDPDGDNVFTTTSVPVTIPGAFDSLYCSSACTNDTLTFWWTPSPLDTGLNVFTVTIQDDACPIPGVMYYTYDIYVLDKVYAGPDDTICRGQSYQLQAYGGGTSSNYVWTFLDGTPVPVDTNFSCQNCSNPIASPDTSTTYIVSSPTSSACATVDTVRVVVVPDFQLSVTGDSVVCNNSGGITVPLNLTITPAGTYTVDWYNGTLLNDSTVLTPTASPTADSTYFYANVSSNGCTKTSDSALIIIVGSFPALQGNLTFCENDSTLLSVNGLYDSYQWYFNNTILTNDTNQTLYVTQPGNYFASVTVGSCSFNTDTFNISEIIVPKPVIPDTSFCVGSNVVLNAGSGYSSYSWNTGNSGQLLNVTQPGQYWVTVTQNGCTKTSDTINVTAVPSPTPQIVTINGDTNFHYCFTDSLVITTVNTYNSYIWNPSGATTQSTTAGAGTYTVTVTDNTGCTGSASVVITSSSPTANVYGLQPVCPGALLELHTDNIFDTIIWSNGDNNDTTIFSQQGNQFLIVADAFGCIDTANFTIQTNPVPTAAFSITPEGKVEIFGDIVFTDLSAGNPVYWHWDFGNGDTSNIQNPTTIYETPGTYPITLTVTNQYGCVDQTTMEYIIISDLTIPNVITPNGDGKNDKLVFPNLQFYPDNYLVIYNRWGKKVYEKQGYDNSWVPDVNSGTYYFVLDVPILEKVYKGSITIIK